MEKHASFMTLAQFISWLDDKFSALISRLYSFFFLSSVSQRNRLDSPKRLG